MRIVSAMCRFGEVFLVSWLTKYCLLRPEPSRSSVFWEQQGLQTFGQRIQITRPHASQPAFEKHFAHLIEEYKSVHAINLLGTKENEAILASSYANHLQHARVIFGSDIGITNFDFHHMVRYAGHEGIVRELRYVRTIVLGKYV